MTPVREALEEVRAFMKADIDNGDSDLWTAEYRALWDTVNESLSAAPGEPCAVKPLAWCRESPTEWKPETWRADSLAGEYDIQREKDGRFSGFAPNAGTNLFGTLDEAKAAAQADYEQRIKSALVFEGRK